MKKFMALAICLMLVLSCVAAASAETTFAWSGSQISGMPSWSTPYVSSGSNWHISWNASSNVASNRRAVVRAMDDHGNYASSLFVYSTLSSSYHPYKSGFGNGNADTCIAGRLDDRDGANAPLKVSGTFHN